MPVSQSIGFLRQEYWSGLPFPSPGDLPDPEIQTTMYKIGIEKGPTIWHGELYSISGNIMEKNRKNIYSYIYNLYLTDSLCYTLETNTAL